MDKQAILEEYVNDHFKYEVEAHPEGKSELCEIVQQSFGFNIYYLTQVIKSMINEMLRIILPKKIYEYLKI